MPIASIFQALEVTHVDFFVLDVEYVEEKILSTFPFDEVTVDMWAIEHNGWKEDTKFSEFMVSKGYYLLDMLCDVVADYVFIRKGSDLFRRLKVPKEAENRTEICMYKKDTFTNDDKYNLQLVDIRDRHHYPQLEYTA